MYPWVNITIWSCRQKWLDIPREKRLVLVNEVEDVGQVPLRLICMVIPSLHTCGDLHYLVDPIGLSGSFEMILKPQCYGLNERSQRV